MTKENIARLKRAMSNYIKGTFVAQGASAKGQEYLDYINELELEVRNLEHRLINLAKKNLKLQNENDNLTNEICFSYGSFTNMEQNVSQTFAEMFTDEVNQEKSILNDEGKKWIASTLEKLLNKFEVFSENTHYYEVIPKITGVPLYVASDEAETKKSISKKLGIRGEITLTEITQSEYARLENE